MSAYSDCCVLLDRCSIVKKDKNLRISSKGQGGKKASQNIVLDNPLCKPIRQINVDALCSECSDFRGKRCDVVLEALVKGDIIEEVIFIEFKNGKDKSPFEQIEGSIAHSFTQQRYADVSNKSGYSVVGSVYPRGRERVQARQVSLKKRYGLRVKAIEKGPLKLFETK